MSRALEICRDLVGFNSVTYNKSDILAYVKSILTAVDFDVQILEFTDEKTGRCVENLFASRGETIDSLGILGHLDTVPAGEGWNFDPFKATEYNGKLYGRGIVDMKGGVGCVLAALEELDKTSHDRISIFFTCDEEVGSYEGVQAMLDWAKERNEIPTDCLICEPSSNKKIGDRIYIGHRGSINIEVRANGIQSHSAYVTKESSENALEKICNFVSKISNYDFKDESEFFKATIASPTILNSSNLAVNVIPPLASVNFNVRFSDKFTSESIFEIFKDLAEKDGLTANFTKSGEPYICKNERLLECAKNSIYEELGYYPAFSTGGGTSDGRFMINYCPVVEFGMVDRTLHQVNEHIEICDCEKLKNVYKRFILKYFE